MRPVNTLGASSIIAIVAGFAAPAFAQEVRAPESPGQVLPAPPAASTRSTTPADGQAATAQSSGLNDIVVTARRVSERLQDVPVAVTAFSGAALVEKNAVKVADIASFTPGFFTRESPANSSALFLSLRGQVQNDNIATVEPSVGTYVDGIYWARAYGLNADLVDVQSVQVLKGPQGTLFGRNTSAGALVLTTNDPDPTKLSGLVQGTYGRFDERAGTAVLNLPLASFAAVRGAFQINRRDGFVKDRVSSARYYNRDSLTGRAKLLLLPTDNLRVVLSGEWYESDQDIGRFSLVTLPATGSNSAEIGANLSNRDTTIVSAAPYSQFLGTDDVPSTRVRTQTYSAVATLDASIGTIKWLNAYRHITSVNEVDLDGSSQPSALTALNQNLKQWSSELLLTGTSGILDYASGITYLKETGFDQSLSFGNAPGVATRFRGEVDNDSFGMFGQVSAHITDRLTATGGLRYSIDDKAIITKNGAVNAGAVPAAFLPNLAVLACVNSSLSPATDCAARRKDNFNALSYTVGLDYKITPRVLAYIKASKGFRSGGQQLRSLTVNDNVPFQPELNYEQEIGLKSEFFGRTLRINLSVYHNTIDNAQRSTITVLNGIPQTVVENAKVRNYGAEADIALQITDYLTITATGSHNDPKYVRYVGVLGAATNLDKSDTRFNGLIDNQFTLGADFKREISLGRLAANVNYSWAGSGAYDFNNVRTLAFVGITGQTASDIVAATTKPKAGILGARLSLDVDEHFQVAVFGRNILNKRYVADSLFVGSVQSAYVSAIRNDPVTYGVTLTGKF